MEIGNWEFAIVPYHWALPLSIFWMPGDGHVWVTVKILCFAITYFKSEDNLCRGNNGDWMNMDSC